MEKCSIIIAARDEAVNLSSCLASVLESDYPPSDYEIIVVDNDSTDDTAEVVAGFPSVRYLKEDRPGPSSARNAGIAAASHDVLVFLDADTTVDAKWLTTLLAPFEDPSVSAVGGEIRPMAEGNMVSEYLSVSLLMRYHRYGGKRPVKGYPSCNLAVRKTCLGGGFDPDITRGQDKDICYRMIENGGKIVFQPGAVIYHDHPRSLGGLVELLVKGARARALLKNRHKRQPDALLLDLHTPPLYLILVLLPLLSGNYGLSLIFALPAALFLFVTAAAAFRESKKFFLCFFVKPVLDVFSVLVTYASYTAINAGNTDTNTNDQS
jgi:GT2 family glycosyltransferase